MDVLSVLVVDLVTYLVQHTNSDEIICVLIRGLLRMSRCGESPSVPSFHVNDYYVDHQQARPMRLCAQSWQYFH